jgi:hypothetical protein
LLIDAVSLVAVGGLDPTIWPVAKSSRAHDQNPDTVSWTVVAWNSWPLACGVGDGLASGSSLGAGSALGVSSGWTNVALPCHPPERYVPPTSTAATRTAVPNTTRPRRTRRM